MSPDHFIQSIADALLAGDSGAIVDHLVWPFPFYLDNHPLVLRGPRDGARAISDIGEGLRHAGVCSVVATMAAQGLPHAGKEAHFYQFHYLDRDGNHMRSATFRFWLYRPDASTMPLIEMAEVHPMAFPQILDRLGLTAQRAS